MYVHRERVYPARVFRAEPDTILGDINLSAPGAGDRARYEFAYSIDVKKTWVFLPVTGKASVVVRGLTLGTRVYFRYRAGRKDSWGDWSDPISAIVR
jgi:hypothetical protein